MVPSAFVILDALPLSANGKVDRHALLNYDFKLSPEDNHVAPRTVEEVTILQIWSDLLGIAMTNIGVYDNFLT